MKQETEILAKRDEDDNDSLWVFTIGSLQVISIDNNIYFSTLVEEREKNNFKNLGGRGIKMSD